MPSPTRYLGINLPPHMQDTRSHKVSVNYRACTYSMNAAEVAPRWVKSASADIGEHQDTLPCPKRLSVKVLPQTSFTTQ